MKNNFSIMRSRAARLTVAIAAMAFSIGANADLPTWATNIAADTLSTAQDSAELVGPVIGFVIVSIVAIKLIKRFSNRI